MVYILPGCPPAVLDAYSTVPLHLSTRNTVHHDFDVGSFARFRDPQVVLSIHDRPDFHSLPHIEIRQRLDAEGHEDGFVLIDDHTEQSHAIWWVAETEESNDWTRRMIEDEHVPPITYPDEPFTLWHIHILTQDLPAQWILWNILGDPIALPADIQQLISPYDPHDPQNPPFTMGWNFSAGDGQEREFLPSPLIVADPGEYDWSDDPDLIKPFERGWHAQYVVRLTQEAATEAGLISQWWPPYPGSKPGPEQSVKFSQTYDWDSPVWAPNGLRLRNATRVGTVARHSAGFSKVCRRPELFNMSSILRGLHRGGDGHNMVVPHARLSTS